MKRREFLVALAATALAPASGWAAPSGFRLRAEPVTARLLPDGQGVTRMLGFNGSTPGPEIRARQGGRVAVAFENGIDAASAIHWHGIHIDNAMDGVPGLTQAAVEPGEMFDYAFDVSHPGTYWYHSHERSWEQVAKGLYGPLIIEERDPPRVDHDITVVIDDWRLTRNGELHANFGNRHDFSHDGRIGNFARALVSREAVRRGDRVRLRLINTATARIFPVRISGGAGKVVAHDGMPLASPEPLGELVLAPAQRTDVILDVAEPVTFALLTRREPYELGKIEAEGANPAPVKTPIAPLPPHAAPAPDRKKARRLTLAMQGGAMSRMGMTGMMRGGDFWAFNGRSGLPRAPWRRFERGETALITMQNDTAFPHGIHIHGHHFYELDENGAPGHYRDTTLVDPRRRRDVLCVFDNPGKWLIHCHTLAHQASGMKTWVEVV